MNGMTVCGVCTEGGAVYRIHDMCPFSHAPQSHIRVFPQTSLTFKPLSRKRWSCDGRARSTIREIYHDTFVLHGIARAAGDHFSVCRTAVLKRSWLRFATHDSAAIPSVSRWPSHPLSLPQRLLLFCNRQQDYQHNMREEGRTHAPTPSELRPRTPSRGARSALFANKMDRGWVCEEIAREVDYLSQKER